MLKFFVFATDILFIISLIIYKYNNKKGGKNNEKMY